MASILKSLKKDDTKNGRRGLGARTCVLKADAMALE
jgi:hypothetical protein